MRPHSQVLTVPRGLQQETSSRFPPLSSLLPTPVMYVTCAEQPPSPLFSASAGDSLLRSLEEKNKDDAGRPGRAGPDQRHG